MPPGQRGLDGRECSPDPLAKSVTIARFVVAGRWACGIDATPTLCVRSFQTRVLRTRATRHNGRDEPRVRNVTAREVITGTFHDTGAETR
jgi:hypothetical protein